MNALVTPLHAALDSAARRPYHLRFIETDSHALVARAVTAQRAVTHHRIEMRQ